MRKYKVIINKETLNCCNLAVHALCRVIAEAVAIIRAQVGECMI